MKTIIAATAVVAALASSAFAGEPTNGPDLRAQSSYGYVDNTIVGSISANGAHSYDGKNLNAIYGFDGDHGVSVGTRSSQE
ncbi:hypothetical protein [Rhizobium sp. CAU 1783]